MVGEQLSEHAGFVRQGWRLTIIRHCRFTTKVSRVAMIDAGCALRR
jgi:hypothetical protein